MAAFSELASQLLGLSAAPSERQRRMAAASAELILRDLIQQCRKTAAKDGPGVLAVFTSGARTSTRWATAELINENLAIAEAAGDGPMVELQRRMLQRLESIDPERHALLLLCATSGPRPGCRFFQLDEQSDPQRLREQLLELGA